MKKTIRKAIAIITVLCCCLSFGTTAYASDDEWGVIPEGYVLFVPSAQSKVTAGAASDSSSRQNVPPVSGHESSAKTVVVTLPGSSGKVEAQPEKADESNCPYTPEEFAAVHLEEINRIRKEHGLAALETDPTLTDMAQERIEEYRWDHKRADGSAWYTIFEEYDTGLRAAGENWISSGNNPYSQMDAFMRSDGHSANILNPDSRYVGIGVKLNDEGTAISVVHLFAK